MVNIKLLFDGPNRVTSGFRTSDRPTHNGLDVVGDNDRTIHSVSSGVVGFSGCVNDKASGGHTWEWGNYVRVDGDDGLKYYYCHMSVALVGAGERVQEGTPIGIMGNTGYSFGAHTHFEVRKGSEKLNPADILGIPNQKGVYTMSEQTVWSGIDVSKYQGHIDWNKVKASGQYFAFIRVGFCNSDGSITNASGFDPYFHENMKNAIAAGMNVGVYVYSYANTVQGAINCANNVINYVTPYKVTMPIVFDYEDSKTYASMSKQANVDICKAFLNRVQELGYYAMLYTYTNFANSYLNMAQLSAYDFWVADYRAALGYKGNYSIWQYSSSGEVPGISGRVDMNRMYKDLPKIIEDAGLNGLGGVNVPDSSLENVYLETRMVENKNPNEYFNSMDVNDVGGRLDIGEYKVAELYEIKDGFNWAKIIVDGTERYAVYDNGIGLVQDGRAILVDKSKPVEPDEPDAPSESDKPNEPVEPDSPEDTDIDKIMSMLRKAIDELNAEIESMKKAIVNLENKISSLTKENDELKSKNKEYLDKLNGALKEAQETVEALK